MIDTNQHGYVLTETYRTPLGVEQLHPVNAMLSSEYHHYSAAKCIDGDTTGHATREGNMCHTQKERFLWITLDFGTTVTIERVEIVNRDDCCGHRTRNLQVLVSDKPPSSSKRQLIIGGILLGLVIETVLFNAYHATAANVEQHITVTGHDLLFLVKDS